jgi:hypothetical protein
LPQAAQGSAPTADPSPLSPIERITEILERLFLARPDLTTELLAELRRCDTSALLKTVRPGASLAVDARGYVGRLRPGAG